MRLPWVSAARYDDALRMMGDIIGEKDHRIAELEKERKLLADKILVLTGTFPVYAPPAQPADTPEEEPAPSKPLSLADQPIPHRPGAIVNRMSALAHQAWMKKQQPNDEVIAYFDNLSQPTNGKQ
jgi:hypothetical protein